MWILLGFLTALFTTLQEIVTKKIVGKIDPYVIAWSWLFFSLPFYLVVFLKEPMPVIGPQFWKAVIVSTVILSVACVYYVKAIQVSDLSLCVPMLAFTPLFLLVTSPLLVNEFPTPIGLVGVVVIVIGSYILNIKDRAKGWLMPFKDLITQRGPRYMLIVAFLFSIGANMDKIGVVNSSPIVWIFTLNLSVCVILTFVMLKKSSNIFPQLKSQFGWLCLAGFYNGAAILFQMVAIQMTLVPYLIAVKRTSALMTVFYGLLILKEEGLKERLLGAFLMVLGVYLIAFTQ
ncbi:MAG TPA: EamA family transporter [Candidatus Omnitrophota bacterium]|nr:EamA family transporter [Candidatus Omnitrophota bacterium]